MGVADAYAQVFECNGPVWERVTELVSEFLAVSDGAEMSILDLASGPGEPATTLARTLPRSRVTCTDVEEDMVALSRRRASGMKNIDFAVASADNLEEFKDSSFDAVTMVQGLQFVS